MAIPPTPAEKVRAADAFAQGAIDTYWGGRYDEALALAEEGIRVDPSHLRTYGAKALILLALGRAAEALATTRGAIARDAGFGALYSILGMCYARLGDDSAAGEAFEKGLALSPDDARVYYNYACYWAQRGDAERCRRMLEGGLKLDPRQINLVIKDADFARFAADDWFRDLVAEYKAKILRRKSGV